MKKIITILLSIGIITALTACTQEEVKETSSSASSSILGAVSKDETENSLAEDTTQNYQTYEELPGTVRKNNSFVFYAFDTPSDSNPNASTGNISKSDNYFVIYDHYVKGATEANEIDVTNIKSVTDVVDIMKVQLTNTMSVGLILAEEYEITIDSQEEKTVNGWEMSRFYGNIELINDAYPIDYYNAKFVGYSVIKDDYPIYFAVVDSTPEQSTDIDEMTELAVKIATTFRHYE